jgi:hypothetical protein
MFDLGKVYRHQNARDLDIYVINKVKENDNQVQLTIVFISKLNNQIMSMEDITISKDDFKYWSEVEN